MYVNDIIIVRSSLSKLIALKTFLHTQYKLKDFNLLKYLLGLEIFRSNVMIILSQCHYFLQLLEDTSFLGSNPHNVLMNI